LAGSKSFAYFWSLVNITKGWSSYIYDKSDLDSWILVYSIALLIVSATVPSSGHKSKFIAVLSSQELVTGLPSESNILQCS